ncbi:hypothetical protein GHT06_013200 [Daphnia sinensis]|uniref:Lysosomal Pro-X carboxypeptidase n=1 Tax=Daphnia sinensis TaxID=1820382 RepID=A0AAD5LHQ3_9CRUS|nr:hypothetical protein GHT06_013200 [Daphnia sinensis]
MSWSPSVHRMLFFTFICLLFHHSQCYSWKTAFFKQQVDHFSFANQDTYAQRYLVNSTYWKRGGGPIFFYTGNEGDIEWFAQNTGFMWDIAEEFGAMLIFAEHRYYGQSLPYGNKSYSDAKYLGYLTSEQALADFAELLAYVKSTSSGAAESPVIAFGGSYGGMLAAWMRIKYPHIITGAIAASAPILQFTGLTPCDAFNRVVTADFSSASAECAESIRKSWKALSKILVNDEGKEWIRTHWNLCVPLNGTEDVANLKDWLTNVWTNLAMVNYPYPANFLAPLPAYPVKAVCEHLTNSSLDDHSLLDEIFKGLSVYANFTGQTQCLDVSQQADQSLGDMGWDFQACTEMVMPMCGDGINDMFEAQPWNLEKYSEKCLKKWKVNPRPLMAPLNYGGRNISSSSNIVFSNGLLDPWSTGGVTKSLSDSLIAIIIPEGAHHLDLRAADPNDPPSVIKAREIEKQFISKWISSTKRDRKEMSKSFIVG